MRGSPLPVNVVGEIPRRLLEFCAVAKTTHSTQFQASLFSLSVHNVPPRPLRAKKKRFSASGVKVACHHQKVSKISEGNRERKQERIHSRPVPRLKRTQRQPTNSRLPARTRCASGRTNMTRQDPLKPTRARATLTKESTSSTDAHCELRLRI